MKSWQDEQDAIQAAIGEFPRTFALRSTPDRIFRISQAHSYVNHDSDTIMLYTEILKDGNWLSYCKGTISELVAAVIPITDKAWDAAHSGKPALKELHVACTNVMHNEVNCLHSDLRMDEWCEACKAAWHPVNNPRVVERFDYEGERSPRDYYPRKSDGGK